MLLLRSFLFIMLSDLSSPPHAHGDLGQGVLECQSRTNLTQPSCRKSRRKRCACCPRFACKWSITILWCKIGCAHISRKLDQREVVVRQEIGSSPILIQHIGEVEHFIAQREFISSVANFHSELLFKLHINDVLEWET